MFEDDYNLNKLQKIDLGGFQMYITPRYLYHYVQNRYEPFSTEIVKNYLKKDATFVDIGAHYGYYSLLAANSDKNVKVISIEPVKENYNILKKNIHLNKLKNCELYNIAASDKKEIKIFNVTEASDSAGFYLHPNTKTKEKINIQTINIDEILKGKKVDFIKIDVEGHEIKVLNGLKETLKKNKNIILLVEFNPQCLENGGFKPDDLLEKIEKLGFEIFLVDENNRKYYRLKANKYSWKDLMGTNVYANILCLNKEKALLTTYFGHSAQLGGAERVILDLINQTKQYGGLAHVIIPDKGILVDKLEDSAVSWDVIRYYWWIIENEKNDLENNFQSFINTIDFLTELDKINPHVICTNTMVIPWGAITALLLNKPHLWYINEFGDIDHGLNFFVSMKELPIIINKLSNKIIFVSKVLKERFKDSINSRKGETIYPTITIPQNLIKEKVEKIFKLENSLKLITVGFVAKSKGQDQIVKAVINLIKKGYKVELLILGRFNNEDPYLQGIKQYIDSENIQNIYLKNVVANPYPYIRQADALVLASRSEAFGRVLVESMILKKPVIGAKAGAIPELIVDNQNGYLFELGNIADLEEKIILLLKNKKNWGKMGNNGYKLVQTRFNEKKCSRKFFNVLLKLRGNTLTELENTAGYFYKIFSHGSFTKTEVIKETYFSEKLLFDKIKISKFYKVWRAYHKVIDYLFGEK